MKKSTAPRRKVAARRPRRAYGRRRPIAKRSNVPDKASLSVKTSIQPQGGGNFAGNIMYNQINVQLANFDRALQVAGAYQFYRISKVKLTYLFPYDTFQVAVGGASRPNFYYMIDKSGALPLATTIDMLKQMGARPRQIDNKPTSVSWTPAVLTEEETLGGAVAAQYKLSPWLSVNAPNVQHRGIYWFVEQLFAGGTQYEVEMEVQFEFKKPLWTRPPVGVVPPAVGAEIVTHAEVLADAAASVSTTLH